MKKIIFSTLAIAGCMLLRAQSLEQARQQLYYERYESAEATLHTLLAQQPLEAGAWQALTKAYLLQKDPQGAADSLHQAPAAVQSAPLYQVARGALLLYNGKRDSAQLLFDAALRETREKDAGVLSAIAGAHLDAPAGDARLAADLLHKAIKRDKRNPAHYVLLGNAWLKQGNGSEAFKAYQEALQANSRYAAAHHQMGELFWTQKNAEVYLDHFNKALAADPAYAPALYRLYAHYFYKDAPKALALYRQYMNVSDHSLQNEYELTDLLYLTGQYKEAARKATDILATAGTAAQPRMYKLLGYSHEKLQDTAAAVAYMQQYLALEADSNLIAKDFEVMGRLYAGNTDRQDSAAFFYTRAIGLEKDAAQRYGYYKKLAELAAARKDFAGQARWLSAYYSGNASATNVDLFNWGLAHFRAEEYQRADSVFGLYVQDQPKQGYGYYWRARSNALQDPEMKEGLAIPHYRQLISVIGKDTADANHKKWLVEAYGYLAAYETNTEKDYGEAVGYFEQLLLVDPANEDAKKYITMLEKKVEAGEGQ